MSKLKGKIALVTGAGRGIGRGIALELAREGAAIAIAEIDPEGGQNTVREIETGGGRAMTVTTDVRNREQVNAAVSAAAEVYGTVDILINNAQIQRQQVSFEDTTDDDMDVVLTSGIHATFYFMQACFPLMRKCGGKIINVASAAGLLGHPGWTSYAVAKEGIRALTKVAAREWGTHKINVNAICPAAETPSFRLWRDNHPDLAKALTDSIPLGHLGDPEADIGRAVVFLASNDSDFVTGATLMVDGGQTILH
ncbi:MAG: SDR family oxidoreductase [bacterium]|nr:oxidoreductase [Deltaproteobacteria bacterium]MCP4905407.1 SDR family oxidoreductase [bacterium]